MAQGHYAIEQLDDAGKWFVLGTDTTSGWAQHYMRDYLRLDARRHAFRVVERPSGRLIVCEGGPA